METGPKVCPEITISTPWLRKSFLKVALRTGYGEPTLKITKYDVKKAVGKGENYCSDLYRVTVYTEDGKVSHLIIKRQLDEDGEIGRALKNSTVFDREIQMYSTTAVEMAKILEEAGICDQFAARYLYSCPGTIVIQDLCAEGFKMAERHQGFNLPHCSLVLRTLAKFHATSAVLHSRDPKSFSLYDQNIYSEPATREGLNKFVIGSLQSVAAAVERWPDYGEKYAGKIRTLANILKERMVETGLRDNSAFNVLNHSDLWSNNILFRYSGQNNDLEGIRFVDFQFLHFSSPAIDLQLFFNTTPSEDVRLHHMKHLMKEYYNTLSDTLTALDYSDKSITLEELWKEYDRKRVYGVFGTFCILPLVLAEKGIDLNSLMESETGKQCDVYNGEFFKKVLQRMLPIFEEKEIFKF